METIKAGCFLINKERREVTLVYREKQKDYSFPKGHKEDNESIIECAIRETEEETKRIPKIVEEYEPYVERYTTPKGEECVCYMYIAIDNGESNNDSLDTHDIHWIPVDKVYDKLSYPSLKNTWNDVIDNVYLVINN